MTPTPSSDQKSPNGPVIAALFSQLLAQVVSLAGSLGELRAETRLRHQNHTERITALEQQRMDTMPGPSSRRESTSTVRWLLDLLHIGELVKLAVGLVRMVPWGFLFLMGAAAWQWAAPLFKRLLPWVL